MLLKDLVRELPGAAVEGSLEREIAGIAYDSRRVMPGMVFVALPGRRVDGHEFIGPAVDRGAAAVICERNGILRSRATRIRVPDTREALARAAISFYHHPADRLKLIGVTGTNGKTVVAFMVKHLLETAGVRTGLIGTVHYEVGDRLIPAQRTTPESLELQHYMAQMLSAGCRACVLEVSSHALDQKRVFGIEFDVAIFTNLTHDHIDYHGSIDRYFAAKQVLFQPPVPRTKQAAAVINIDDHYGARLADATHAEIKLTYGLHRTAHVRASNIRLDRQGSRFAVHSPRGRFPCRLPLIGRHNVYNALATVGAGFALNARDALIQSALNTLPPVPGRLEPVPGPRPFSVFVDYAHTDDALRNVLTALREVTPHRILLLFGCGGNRDAAKRARMGKVAAELADLTLITSDNPRQEDPAAIAAQIESGFRTVRPGGCGIELDRQRAIARLLGQARPGDSVLLAGKGHETYQEFDNTIVPFDDRVVAQEALESIDVSTRRSRS
ncbi:MAG: UDP-N-acetylmuramoyl-L-alanyl-D-glutamate--2,6-diaminopimelate ligase [Verrucomicrobia bacterium]|nr:UDP-N-acetylmuramoyl-L-alanyl-D-glutamate--2,6-diaminopimelate ligase [Verrucomicrobiota bacterium]